MPTYMDEMMIRKKALKIQERLGMRLGISLGTYAYPVVRNFSEASKAIEACYNIGLKAFVLPHTLFRDIKTSSDLYKVHYGDLIRMKDLAHKHNIELSLHHPELADQPDEELKLLMTIAGIIDARIVSVHPAFYSRMPREQALKLVVHKLSEMMYAAGASVRMGVETTGKVNETGSIEDIIEIAKRTRRVEPVINWAHIHARGVGALRSENDFKTIISKVVAGIGKPWLGNAYFFFSGISYGPSGEIRHIHLDRSDIKLDYLIRAIMSFSVKGTLIFEDPEKERFILKILDPLAGMVR